MRLLPAVGDVVILDSALKEWFHPSAVLLLACLSDPFPGHSLWATSPTQMLCVQSLSSLCTAALKSDLFALGLIYFGLQTALLVLSVNAQLC